jgi:hypothetical protein
MIKLYAVLLAPALLLPGAPPDWELRISQITFGPKHHFFGYIGHVQNIPWNRSGRYIAVLRSDFQDHMPGPAEAAEIVLLDTKRDYAATAVDRSHAWNIQQGTMMYWNPQAADTQLFFNDRDPKTGKVFTVLYDVAKKQRVKEFRFDDTPFGNSGVAQKGGSFLGLNYGRLARLRSVTGYKGAYDWTEGQNAPANDGIFIVDVATGRQRVLVSFKQLADLLRSKRPDIDQVALFINHTLWNRNDDRIYFYVRGNFDDREKRVDQPCTIRPDGTGLTAHSQFIGGHPEWEFGSRIIGDSAGRQILYDVDKQEIVGQIGTPEILPRPGGDVALSPDGKWFVNGYREGVENIYVVLRRSDGSWQRTKAFPHKGWTGGDLRLDAAPAWNRASDAILFPALAPDGTRQSFIMRIQTKR